MPITDLIDSRELIVEPDGSEPDHPPILSLLHDGKELVVQVSKEPIGTKGARITSNLTLASRYLVYLPGSRHVGISQRIDDEPERLRLKELLESIQQPGVSDGFIVRTASEGVSEEEIKKDAELLRARWAVILKDAESARPETLVYEDLPLPLRVMRDIINSGTDKILVDDAGTFSTLQRFLEDFIPDKVEQLQLVSDKVSLFDAHNLEDQIEAALDRKVPLKSGGYLIVDQCCVEDHARLYGLAKAHFIGQ